jgi:hypothetical protein
MEPAEAVNLVEANLRELVRLVLGEGWIAASGLEFAKLEERRAEEQRRRDGASVPVDLLEYMHLYELRKIINAEWAKFKPIFDDRKRFDVYLDRLEDFRNAPMHSRELLPFERDLLSGIAGEIRNLATIYRSQRAPDMTYYPSIEAVTDSFGNALRSYFVTNLRLNVGQTVSFNCRGWDPQGRQLSWTLRSVMTGARQNRLIAEETGNQVTLFWTVDQDDVGEELGLFLALSSAAEFHRKGTYDDSIVVVYAVNPPHGG